MCYPRKMGLLYWLLRRNAHRLSRTLTTVQLLCPQTRPLPCCSGFGGLTFMTVSTITLARCIFQWRLASLHRAVSAVSLFADCLKRQ